MTDLSLSSGAVDRVKAALSMRDVAEKYGLEITRGGFVACPFHADKTPSLKLYNQPGRGFYCYGCGTGGSVIDFAMKLFNLDFRAATVRLAVDFGLPIAATTQTREEALMARAAQTERQRRQAEYNRLIARWRRMTDIARDRAPADPDAEWSPEWCEAIRELPALEHEIEMMEAEGFGR